MAERGGARSSGISITLSTHSPTFFDKDTGSVSKRLATSIAAVDQQHSTASLRGLEGAGAEAYFEGFADLLPDRLKFSGRIGVASLPAGIVWTGLPAAIA